MTFLFLYTDTAKQDILKLDRVQKQRLKKTLERYQETPLYYAKKLINSKIGDYRFRVGNFRVIFDLDGDKIVVLRVAHRKEIYRV